MRSPTRALLVALLLWLICFSAATRLDTWFHSWPGNRTHDANILTILMGDAKRMFANHFYVKADAYFHSGYYPTIFDNRQAFQTPHMAEDTGNVAGRNQGDEEGFLGPPRDWIDAFSRSFFPSVHTHLDHSESGAKELGDSSDVREILPWLKLSIDLDPNRIETYTVTSYWLRERMNKYREAEQLLREGLKNNPNSYEIMYELGRIYAENRGDTQRARNLWVEALRQWDLQESKDPDPNLFMRMQILSHLALLEEKAGDAKAALVYLHLWKNIAVFPTEVQKRIHELEQRQILKPVNQ